MSFNEEQKQILWKAAEILAKRRTADKVCLPISSNNERGLLSFENCSLKRQGRYDFLEFNSLSEKGE